ncbi:conserved hypothetical protein [Hoeflea sp. EC-HK425]|nr:conserved hypothetical protein [Hoeflea sp. EC-HK425]
MQKRAKSARAGSHARRLTRWFIGLAFAFMSAAGLYSAFEVECGGEAVAQVTVSSAQNGRQRTSAVVSASRTGGLTNRTLRTFEIAITT